MPEILYEQVKAAQYMARLLRAGYFYIERGDNFFDYLIGIGVNLKRLLTKWIFQNMRRIVKFRD